MKPWLPRVGLVLASAALALLLAEGAARLLLDEQDAAGNYWGQGAFVALEGAGYMHRPGFDGWAKRRGSFTSRIRIDAHGLRQTHLEDQLVQPRRLLVLGDSFTFGLGVDEEARFLDLLTPDLNRRGVGVINGAQTGYGVRQEAAWGRTLLARFRPEQVLVCLFVGNDFMDDWEDDATRVEVVDGWRLSRERLAAGTVLDVLRTRSRLGLALSARANQRVAAQRRAAFERLLSLPEERAKLVGPTLRALRELATVATLSVVLLPPPPGAPDGLLAPILREHLRSAGIPCADLTGLSLDVRTDFLPADGHWNARGHRKAAEALRPLLLEITRGR